MKKSELRQMIREEIERLYEYDPRGEEDSLYTKKDTPKVVKQLERGIKAPYVNVHKWDESGKSAPLITIKVSLDDKKDWPGNKFDRSRFGYFYLSPRGSLEAGPVRSTVDKMRRGIGFPGHGRVDSIKDVINAINKWVKDNKDRTHHLK